MDSFGPVSNVSSQQKSYPRQTLTILAPGNSKINIPKKSSMLATPLVALQEKLVNTPYINPSP
ncbi:hypothetical protein OnM2_005008 [Erysiphe neolycopersici]|uniref:Uncharacterized protein n=1 Tax=Erysiphe neolycopersici TaxID=212602 RepID=A0A420I7D1_9PEZI|nr:hypothetical protein OnM2_005008 [Erysiphe neolycopersici]